MGLSVSERRAVTRVIAKRYARATKAEQGAILDELCEWDETGLGFYEMDLVAHDGPRGEFCQTLDLTDVASGWTEMRSVKTRPHDECRVLGRVEGCVPFALLGIDSDNGASHQ